MPKMGRDRPCVLPARSNTVAQLTPTNDGTPDGHDLRRWRYRYLILFAAGVVGATTFLIGQLVFSDGYVAIIIVGAGYFALLFFVFMPYVAWRETKKR